MSKGTVNLTDLHCLYFFSSLIPVFVLIFLALT